MAMFNESEILIQLTRKLKVVTLFHIKIFYKQLY